MKKLWIIPIVLLLAAFTIGYAQQVFVGAEHELEWDAEPIPPYATQTYEVCALDRAGGMPIILGEVAGTTFLADISAYDFEVTFGVRTVWVFTMDVTIEGTHYHVGDRLESVWNYSDVNGEFTPNPFVGCSKVVLAPPKGLEHIQ